ncbi:hypothetical protein ACF073_38910 [Streptomyces sp. NPDC015171]|uniref:hypothetical protein n=1 Tax=Streptomyces sp. NPDC015171 TaxID=3364945 RepID=UPI0037031EC2
MPRRLLPLLVAALISAAGCTTVSSAPAPGPAPRSPAAGPVVRPTVLRAPVKEPSAYAALVRTGRDRPAGPAEPAAPGRGRRPAPALVPPAPSRAAAPAAPPVRHPRPERRTPVRRPAQRRGPAARPAATLTMRDLCGQADGLAAPGVVQLCHDAFG